jgi:hypothetical protein
MLRRGQAPEHFLADRLLANAVDKRFHDPEVDVGFEQRETNLAKRSIDGRFGEAGLTSQRLEDALKTIA